MPSTKALQWLSLVGIVWLQSINGTNTNFPAYSSQLKNALSMSQLQLNNLAFASDAGKLFGWFSGIAAIYLPLWLVLMIGSTLGLIGYGVQYLSITNQMSSLSYWQIFLLTVVAGNSICWINTVSYVVSIRNFPCHRQIAVGLSTSYQGLSAKIYTDVVDTVASSSPVRRARTYLFLNSLFPLIVCVIAAPFARAIELGAMPQNTNFGFVLMFGITIATGIYSVISSLGVFSSSSSWKNLIGTCGFLLVPLAVPLAEKIKDLVSAKLKANKVSRVHSFAAEESEGRQRMEEEEFKDEELGREEVDDNDDHHHGVGVRDEMGVKSMMLSLDFWLYFFVYFSSATLGLVFLNNLGQIAESRGFSSTSSLVSLSSSFGFFGRLIPSVIEYFFSRSKYMVSSSALMAILVAPIAGSFFLLLNSTNHSLYISTAIIGVCTGAITSISVSTTTELFGTKNFSVNHNVVVANIPIGSFLFGYLAALVYNKETIGDGKCMGMGCYRSTFIIWGCLCCFGTVVAVILYARTRKFYNSRQG
ncbi:hypothetical protein UlMin_015342 [Ulmus minor]